MAKKKRRPAARPLRQPADVIQFRPLSAPPRSAPYDLRGAFIRQIEEARAHWLAMARASLRPPPGTVDEITAGFARLYEGTGDPFHAWAAYRIAQDHGRPVPAVVTSYLERAAHRLVEISQTEPAGKRFTAAVIDALELHGHGRGAVFARRKQLAKAEQYAAEVLALKRNGRQLATAIASVAREHKVTRKAVRDAYNRVRVAGRFFGSISGRAPIRGR